LQINQFFHEAINNNKKTILIGEDIDDPYGGAFKVSKGLSKRYEDNVISTPISEAGIVGMGIGMSLLGYNPFIEIMFGDFISYSFDQILSNASKFFHMYNKQVAVPITIRTPMGGGRGYGPTHSQSIEKIFNGLNNIRIVALNTLIDSNLIFKAIENFKHATILIENKIDYGRLENKLPKTVNYSFKKSNSDLPIIVGTPDKIKPEISIITYGGSVHCALESIDEIFYEFEILPRIIVLTELYPINFSIIASLVMDTNIVLTVEEGNIEGGFGSEIIAGLVEQNGTTDKKYKRVGSINVPIPSSKTLEQKILVNTEMIINTLRSMI
jgi:2-oxoisovalerate dehydrogenase E1 component